MENASSCSRAIAKNKRTPVPPLLDICRFILIYLFTFFYHTTAFYNTIVLFDQSWAFAGPLEKKVGNN